MRARKILAAGLVTAAMGALLAANLQKQPPSGVAMTRAGQSFLTTLTEPQRNQAAFEFDSPERLNWHFIPRERKGLPLKDLEGDALKAAHKFIQSGLSNAGYDQALNVMSLEEVLYLLEGGEREYRRDRRDPGKYYLSIFGKPGLKGTWGWRVEGHHLSLNYVVKDGEVVSSTPEFFGANPGTIDAGPERRIRVLGPEEDMARQILKLCSPEQQEVAWIEKKAPDDLRGAGEAQPVVTEAVGLPFSKMNANQKELLQALLTEYLKNMPADVSEQRRAKINQHGPDNIRFAWWGSSEQDERHYYRVQGDSFIIEYNNTQNNANHVHSMWRDLAGDFNKSIDE